MKQKHAKMIKKNKNKNKNKNKIKNKNKNKKHLILLVTQEEKIYEIATNK